MAFRVPPAKRSIKQNVYEFQMPDSEEIYELPLLRYIKPSLVEELDGGKKSDIVRKLLETYVPGIYERFEDADQLVALYEDWARESGMTLGESSGSTDSPASTEEPSAETSSSPDSPSTTSAPTD